MVLFQNGDGCPDPDESGGRSRWDPAGECHAAARRGTAGRPAIRSREEGGAGGPQPRWAESWPAAGQLAVCVRPFWKAPKEPVPIANARNAPPAGAVFSNVFMNFIGDLLSNFGCGE